LTPARITVVAAVLNERGQIDEWLSHLGWVERIVAVDHGSNDGTRQRLAEDSRVEIIDAPPGEGLVEDIRCLGLDAVDDGWILVLDVDERISIELRDEILELLSGEVEEMGFLLPFRHLVFGRWLSHGGWDDAHLRLFRAGEGRYLPGVIHSDARVAGAVGRLNGEVLHFGLPTIHDFLTRMNRYTSQSAPALARGEIGGLRKRRSLPPSPLRWTHAAASVFWNRYIKSRGFLDGTPGFLIAALLSAYRFVELAKAWEARLESSS